MARCIYCGEESVDLSDDNLCNECRDLINKKPSTVTIEDVTQNSNEGNYWLKFYIDIRFPLGFIFTVIQYIMFFSSGLFSLIAEIDFPIFIVLFIVLLSYEVFYFILSILTFINMRKFNYLGYKLNNIILICGVIYFAFSVASLASTYFVMTFIIAALIYSVAFMLPNMIYFSHRKHMFTRGMPESVPKVASRNNNNSPLLNHAPTPEENTALIKDSTYEKTENKWLWFYINIRFPLGFVFSVLFILYNIYYLTNEISTYSVSETAIILFYTLIESINFVFCLFTYLALKKPNLTSYRINIGLLIFGLMYFPIYFNMKRIVASEFSFVLFLLSSLTYALLFLLPNLIYFKKRKFIFLDITEDKNTIKLNFSNIFKNKILLICTAVIILIIIYIMIFKPYMRYDQIYINGKEILTRTNIITGETEALNPNTLNWNTYYRETFVG